MNDNITSVLTGILQSQTKDELMEIGEFFGVLLRRADRKAEMVHRLEVAFRTDTLPEVSAVLRTTDPSETCCPRQGSQDAYSGGPSTYLHLSVRAA